MIQNLILSIGLSFAVGLSGAKDNNNKFINNDTPEMVVYDDNTYEITIVNDECLYTYQNLFNYLIQNKLVLSTLFDSDFTVEYITNNVNQELSFHYSEYDDVSEPNNIKFACTTNNNNSLDIYNGTLEGYDFIPYKFSLFDWDQEISLGTIDNINFTINSTYYNDFKNAIELDIQANQQQPATSMGNSIINAIKSGLGLIGDLASEFLNGFSKLFWQNNSLTTFGTFALVMLGVAIVMAVVSLVLNIIRGNTGA